jgi:hypothetical protein
MVVANESIVRKNRPLHVNVYGAFFYALYRDKGGDAVNRARNLLISSAAALLSGLLVYGVYVLQVKQITLQETVNVVMPKDFIQAGTLLTSDLLELKPIYKGGERIGMYTSLGDVIGQETLLPLGAGEPILSWKMNRFHLLPSAVQSTFQIPKEYVLSVSSGIRAGDLVRVYLSSEDGRSYRLFDHDISVASVKSSNHAEVDNPNHPNLLSRTSGDAVKMYASRLEGTFAIDLINLNLSEAEWLQIDSLCSAKKAKLVIAFSSASIPSPK